MSIYKPKLFVTLQDVFSLISTMTTIKYLLISTLATGLLVLAGCTQTTTNQNANLIDTNNSNNVATVNTNEVAVGYAITEPVNNNSNISTTINEVGVSEVADIDTSDWNKIAFKELGFSTLLPFDDSELSKIYTECGPDQGCDHDGYSYTVVAKRSSHNYALLGSVSKQWSVPRGRLIYDLYDINDDGDEVKILYGNDNNGLTIHPVKTIQLPSRKIYIFDPLQDYYTDSEFYDVANIPPAYAAVIPLNSKKYHAAIMYVETADMSLEEFSEALNSMEFEN